MISIISFESYTIGEFTHVQDGIPVQVLSEIQMINVS